MTVHEDSLRRMLETLRGQWVEAAAVNAEGFQLVTSRGGILRGRFTGAGVEPGDDDGRLLGAVLTASSLAPDGTLTLILSDADGRDPVVLTVAIPWALALPKGAGIAAALDGQIGVREESGPHFARPEALREWEASTPDAVERAVLTAGADDWVCPGDVVSALLREGVTEPGELRRRGIEALARLIARGDLEAGSIDEHGFQASPDTPAEVIETMATVWTALGERQPGPGQIAWFNLTASGEARLRR